jgi:hypothetical protein
MSAKFNVRHQRGSFVKFEVLANRVLVGYSDLEFGDPPMGVAHGVMRATEGYGEFRARVTAAAGGSVVGIELEVRSAGTEKYLSCVGVGILDMSHEIPEPPHVEVLGIPYPEYGHLFPHHVAAYEAQFPMSGVEL